VYGPANVNNEKLVIRLAQLNALVNGPVEIPVYGPDYSLEPPPISPTIRLGNPNLQGDGINNCLRCTNALKDNYLCPWSEYRDKHICISCYQKCRTIFIKDLPLEERFDAVRPVNLSPRTSSLHLSSLLSIPTTKTAPRVWCRSARAPR
jgi:hypothetical protein